MKKLITLSALSALLLVGCNTWQGFGQDLQNAGEAIQNTAR